MKRKMSMILFMTLIFFSLSACGTKGTNLIDYKEVDELAENIGNPKEEVFDNLDIEEGKEIEMMDDDPIFYTFKDERKIDGESFRLILSFDIETDELLEFRYNQLFEDREVAHDLVKNLYEDLNDAYGEPTTYIESLYRIEDLPDLKDLENQRDWNYFETWEKNDDVEVKLNIQDIPDKGSVVEVSYSLNLGILSGLLIKNVKNN